MADHSPDAGPKTIQSVETALSILEAIQRIEPAGIAAITGEVDYSKSTVHHHVSTLLDGGYLERVDDGYRLGLRFLSLGGQVRARQRLFGLARDDVDRLAGETGEQARLIVERDGVGVTIYRAIGEHGSATDTHVGSSEDLYCTAAGKAFLAELSEDALDAYLDDQVMTRYTDDTVDDERALRDQLQSIRADGVAFDDEEIYEGVRCVASAIHSSDGDLLGAISVSAPVERMDDERFRTDVPDRIQNVAGVVEVNTAYSGWTDSFPG